MDTVLAIFGGLGIGAIITQIVQYCLAEKAKNNERRVAELKEAFSGLLTAQKKVILNSSSEEHQIEFAYWEVRVKLVASPEIIKLIEEMKSTKPYSEARIIALNKMIKAMRTELGIAK